MDRGGRRAEPRRASLAIGLLVVVVLAATVLIPRARFAPGGSGLQAVTVAADPTVGPLFADGIAAGHSCVASVLLEGRDLLLTAAHCVVGSAAGVQFVPGYDGTQADPAPYGIWTVSRVWISPAWAQGQDPQHDFAILQVADNTVDGGPESVNSRTGGNALAVSPAVAAKVSVLAYPAGSGDAPIDCRVTTFVEQGYPRFQCGGYYSGTSGSPWLQTSPTTGHRTVVGVIGGLHQGGCDDATSYSPYLGADAELLLMRAIVGLPGDDAPLSGGDSC